MARETGMCRGISAGLVVGALILVSLSAGGLSAHLGPSCVQSRDACVLGPAVTCAAPSAHQRRGPMLRLRGGGDEDDEDLFADDGAD